MVLVNPAGSSLGFWLDPGPFSPSPASGRRSGLKALL
jgi:hypothetical protein